MSLEFLHEKADNFRSFILGQGPDAEVVQQINGFSRDMLLPTLTGLVASGLLQSDSLVNDLMAHLTPDDPVFVRAKIKRYFECFYDCLCSV